MSNKNWVFTFNNYEGKEEEFSTALKQHAKYFIIGHEMGEQKTPHLQGFVSFIKTHRLASLKKLFAKEIHWEPKKGTKQQAIDYCKKEGMYIEFGDSGQQGHRTDCDRFMELVPKKRTFREICEIMPQAIRFPRAFNMLRQDYDKFDSPKFRDVHVSVFIGPTGTGKTRAALEYDDWFKLDKANNLWFDGYNREDTLIIDDYNGFIKYEHLLQLLDVHPLRLEIKGGFTYAYWIKIVITTNHEINSWYPTMTDISPLERRIHEIKYFN